MWPPRTAFRIASWWATTSAKDRIRARAYILWEEEGKPEGRSGHHWHQARSEIERQDAEALEGGAQDAAPASAKKGRTPKAKDPHPGMMGDGTEEQNLGQDGDPSARITEAEVNDAFQNEGGDENRAARPSR